MYFVTYLEDVNGYVVIPKTWIKNENIIFEKFINQKGLNSDQTYLCYWTSNPEAVDENGEPKIAFAPDFGAEIMYEFPCTEGCFFGRLVSYHREYFIIMII